MIESGEIMDQQAGFSDLGNNSSSPATAANRRRAWKILFLCLAFSLLAAGCYPDEGLGCGYRPPLLPIEIGIDASGNVSVKASGSIATPIGTFTIEQSLARRNVASSETLLVIRRPVRGSLRDTLIKIRSRIKMEFLLNGAYDFASAGNVAVVRPHRGVSGIRVRNVQGQDRAPRLAAKKAETTTLPTPTGTLTPLSTSPATPTPTPTPTGPVACPTAAADAPAATSCPTTVAPVQSP